MDVSKSFDNFQLWNFVPWYLSLRLDQWIVTIAELFIAFSVVQYPSFLLVYMKHRVFVIHSILLFYLYYTERVIVPVKFGILKPLSTKIKFLYDTEEYNPQ